MGTARGRSCAAAHLSHYPSQDPSQYPGDAGARHSSTHLCCQLKFRRQSVFRSRRGKRHHITWREIRGGVERSTRKCSAFKKQNKKVTRRRARARTCSFTCCTAPRSDTDTASESAGCALAARRQGAGRRFEDGRGARGANLQPLPALTPLPTLGARLLRGRLGSCLRVSACACSRRRCRRPSCLLAFRSLPLCSSAALPSLCQRFRSQSRHAKHSRVDEAEATAVELPVGSLPSQILLLLDRHDGRARSMARHAATTW